MKKFKDLTYNEIIKAIKKQQTLRSILQILGCHDNTFNRRTLKQFIVDNKIDITHFKKNITKPEYIQAPKKCKECGRTIPFRKRQNDFCNHSCSAKYNNRKIYGNRAVSPNHFYCLNCGKELTGENKYCNNTCYAEYQRKEYIKRWKEGEETGLKGRDDIVTAVKLYLRDKYNNSCQLCGWNIVNKFTGLVPLQIHHIDGDCTNNKESNLQLLCPNCHSLTENFGSRNSNCTRIDKRIR